MIKLAVAGALGRMGQRILTLASQDSAFKIVGAVEYTEHPNVGKDVGTLVFGKEIGVFVTAKVAEALEKADVVIDFSHHSALKLNIQEAVRSKTSYVLGTTGLTEGHKKILKEASKKIGVVQAPNMSIGVNLLLKLTELAAKVLDDSYDVEISETHHRMKKDAPSGTAVGLLEVLTATRGKNIKKDVVYGREGEVGARPRGEIGALAMRGGDVVGDHTVFFFGDGERIELTHRASSRDCFAQGSLKAAKFLSKKKNGFFNMQQVLGI